MVRTIFSGAWWIGRLTALTVGLAVMLALVLGVASAALGANGDPWLLGRGNVATAITKLGGALGVNGPMLQLINNNADANDTALDLQVQGNEPPMTVNSDTKVTNLNADKLDGKDFSAFDAVEVIDTNGPLPRQGTFTSKGGTLIISATGSGFRGTGSSVLDGNIGMHVQVDGISQGFASVFTNERDSHKAFVGDYIVLKGLPAGEHTIRLQGIYESGICNRQFFEERLVYCTATDFNDRFRVMVMEIPD